MKKLLLLSLFLVTSLIFPEKTFAANCCSEGRYVETSFVIGSTIKGCCKPYSQCTLSTDFDNSKYQCGIYTCEASSQNCTQTAQTFDPTCPSSSPVSPTGCPSYCCVQSLAMPGTCQYKAGNPFSLGIDCNYIKQWAVGAVPKENCPDPTTKLNASGKCEKIAESIWDLKYDCGPEITVTNSNGSTTKRFSGITTAIGCVRVDSLPEFLTFLLKWVFGAAGGIIVLMLIFTGYNLMTSQGNPEKIAATKENIISIISGLVLIVFSVVLLQAIGVDILKLPGFTNP